MWRNVYALYRISKTAHTTCMETATTLFATLADPIRLRCLALIWDEGELCVCELVAALDLPQPKISRHLAVMRDAGLLRDRREAQWVLYALSSHMPSWSRAAIRAAVEAVKAEPQHVKDLKRLRKAERPLQERAGRVVEGGCC
jgi:ArsR family transcriptional regulator